MNMSATRKIRLEMVSLVEEMLAADPAIDTRNFDIEAWLGEWIKRPQPALGGLAPAKLLTTSPGRESVKRVLGSIQSGAYQ